MTKPTSLLFGRRGSRSAVMMSGLAFLAILLAAPGGEAGADTLSLNTGAATRGDGVGAVDTRWQVAQEDATGRVTAIEKVEITAGTDLPPPRKGDSLGASHWVTPAGVPRGEASRISYVARFTLTKAQAAAAALLVRWSSVEDSVEVTLNGAPVFRTDADGVGFEAWHELSIGAGEGFHDGVNILEFHVLNPPRGADGRSYFRLKGGVSFPSTVPEPATLVLTTASTLILAGLSWKRRLALTRRCEESGEG